MTLARENIDTKYLNQQNIGPFIPGLDLISPKLLPDRESTSSAVMVTLHTEMIET